LTAPELEQLSAAAAATRGRLQASSDSETRGLLTQPKPHCEPFRSLLAHPAIVNRLKAMCWSSFRLDGEPALIEVPPHTERPITRAVLRPPAPGANYFCQNGLFFTEQVWVIWMLSTNPEGASTFAYQAGSHKASCKVPDGDAWHDGASESRLSLDAGDVWFVTSAALRHGVRWEGTTPLRYLRFSYVPRSYMLEPPAADVIEPESWWGEGHREIFAQMSAAQRAVMFGPGLPGDGTPVALEVDADGNVALAASPDRR
jgi:hypothetical protein